MAPQDRPLVGAVDAEELLGLAFRDSPFGMVYHDASTRILACNAAAESILGIASSEMTERNSFDPSWRTIREDGSDFKPEDYPVSVCLRGSKPVRGVVMGIWNRCEGRFRWARIDAFPQFREGEQAPYRVLVWIADETERIEATRAARKSRDLFMSLFDHMAEGVALHELVAGEDGRPSDYRILDVNPQYESHVGIEREGVVGRLASEVYGTAPAPYLAEYAEVAETGKPYRFETYFPPLDKHFLISVASLGGGGFATIFFDISESRRSEAERERLVAELERKNKELEGIVYVASHDLRSPLVNIQGFAARLERDCGELAALADAFVGGDAPASSRVAEICRESLPRSLEFIKASGIKIDRLISGLLRLSRTGRASLARRELDMEAMIREILAAMSFQVEGAGARIEVGSLPPCSGDEDQVAQVFTNLLDNAIKYRSRDRPLEVRISGARVGELTEYVVEDNGIGIDEGRVDRVWELFCRLDPDDGVGGEGLGLTLARRIVERHGGSVKAESAPGKGSRFIVSLPTRGKAHG